MRLLLIICLLTRMYLVSAQEEENNLCPEEIRFTVNVTQMVLRKMTVRNYKWCVNVPPRCSYYTQEQRYVPEVVEKEESRMVNKCCPGFIKDESTTFCKFDCANCLNGKCGRNYCTCNPGFSGTYCDKGCPNSHWGMNCVNQCSCIEGDCNPITGYCSCPPGWKGRRCEYQMENFARTNEDTSSSAVMDLMGNKTSTDLDNLLKSLTKHSERAHYPTFQKYYTFWVTTLKPTPRKELDLPKFDEYGNYQLSSESTSPYDTTASTLLRINSTNFEYVLSQMKNLSAESRLKVDMVPILTPDTIPHESRTKQDDNVINNITTDQVISVTQVSNIIMKGKAMDDIEVSVTTTKTSSENTSQSDEETDSSTPQNETNIKNTHLIFSIGAVAGIIATIILIVAVTIFTTQNYRRNKLTGSILAIASNSKKGNSDGGISAVAIFTRSVFHTPLPDPPTFQSPVFTTPLETIQSTGGALETRVICSMHLQNPSLYNPGTRVIDEFYDHPPSTGSYRAASIPEPPDQNMISSLSKEHLYDEIPYWKQPQSIKESRTTLPLDTFSYYANSVPNKNKI